MRNCTLVDVPLRPLHQPLSTPSVKVASPPAQKKRSASPASLASILLRVSDLTSPTKTSFASPGEGKAMLAPKASRHQRTSALPTMAADAAGAPAPPPSPRSATVAGATRPPSASVSRE